MNETPRARLIAYGVAVLGPVVSLLIRWPLRPVLGEGVPHMAFFPAVLLAAYFGGLWPGLLATLLSAAAGDFLFLEPRYSFSIVDPVNAVALVLFLLVGIMLSILSESLHRTRRRLLANQRQRAEEALRETEDRFRQLAENIHEIFWMKDARDDRMIYISPGYECVSGRTCQSLYEQPGVWVESIHPDDRARVIEYMEQHKRGVFTDGEFRVVRPDGSIRWIRSRAFPIKDRNGAVSRIAGLAEDVTERRQTEEELRLANARIDLAVRGTNIGIWEIDMPDGDYRRGVGYHVNIWEQLGYERPDSPTDHVTGMVPVHPDDRGPLETATCRYLAGETSKVEFESRARHKDGSYRWMLTRGVAVRDAGGKPIRFLGIGVDITDHKRAEEALRESEQRWRGLTEALPQLVWSATPDGACDYFSRQWTEHTGVPEEALLGWRWLSVLHPDDRERTRGSWLESVAGRRRYDVEYRVRRSDGVYRWFKTRGTPIRDGEGHICKWFGTCTDITDAKRAEEELRLAKEAAESANRAKDEFLANVSHEIRTPMNAILGMTELALDTPLSDDQRQCLRTVKSAADNLLGIINDLLDFSKIEAGKLELDSAAFSLRSALGDTLRALAVRAQKKGLELVCHVQPDVTDALVGDAGRLRQILLNLVGNAIKFTESGEVVVRVDVVPNAASAGEVSLRFTVRDTGIGIPKEKQERIFLAFEQEDASTTRKYGGTGLGLTIAARLAALMAGRITVESEPGRGSTFAFTARFGRQPHPPVVARPQDPATAGPPHVRQLIPVSVPAAAPLRILAAEDNEFNAQLLEQLLVRRGHHVQLASNGRQALSMAEESSVDLMLLDVHMPELDGFQVIKAIRERERSAGGHLPVIALTARSRKEDRERCIAAGMDGFLTKPIQAASLWAAIDGVAGPSGLPAERSRTELLDPDVLLAACGGDGVILEKICHAFLAHLPDHLIELQSALREQDERRLREAAHKLGGMAAAFSTAAGGVASDIEDCAAQGRLEEARPLVGLLESMAQELMQVVDGLSINTLREQAEAAENNG